MGLNVLLVGSSYLLCSALVVPSRTVPRSVGRSLQKQQPFEGQRSVARCAAAVDEESTEPPSLSLTDQFGLFWELGSPYFRETFLRCQRAR